MSVNRVFTGVVFVVVIGAVVAGFLAIGSPSHAREQALDQRRTTDIGAIASQLKGSPGAPAQLAPDLYRPRDPESRKPYVYVKESAKQYRLCATFALASNHEDAPWQHPAGPACFRFTTAQDAPAGPAFRAPPSGAR